MSSSRAVRAGRAFVEFFIEDGKVQKGLKRQERVLKMHARRIGNASKDLLKTATVGLAAFALPVKTFIDFDDAMRKVKAITGVVGKDFEALRNQAKELGRETSFTASEVAGLMTELGRAGFSAGEIQNATADVLNLARATDTELARAAEIAAAQMRTFGIDASNMGKVADTLTATTNNSAQGMEDLFEAMKTVGPIAVKAGADIEGTAAAIGVLADNGIKGSLAGSALARAYKNLSSNKTEGVMRRLGVAVEDANGNMRPMSEVLNEIGAATRDLGSRKRLAIFEQLFGRGQAAALALADGGARFEDLDAKIRGAADAARDAAAEMDGGIGGALRRMQSAFEGVQIAIGEALDKVGTGVFDTMSRALGVITAMIEKNPGLVKVALAIVTAIGAAGVAGLALSFGLKAVAASFGLIRMAMSGVALAGKAAMLIVQGLGATMAALASPVGIVVALVAGLAAYFLYASGAIQKLTSFLGDSFSETWGMITSLLASGDLKAAGELALALLKTAWEIGVSQLDKKWQELTGGLAQLLLEATAGAELIWNDFTTALVNAFDKAIAAIRTGWQETTNYLADKIAIVIAKTTGQDVEDVRQTLAEDQDRNRRNFAGEANARAAARNVANEARREEIGQELVDRQQALQQEIDGKIAAAEAGALKARMEFDQAQARAQTVIDANKQAEGDGAADPAADPGSIAATLAAGTQNAVANSAANSAVALQSAEGQKVLAQALGFRTDNDPTTKAVVKMNTELKKELEDVNDNLEDAPKLAKAP